MWSQCVRRPLPSPLNLPLERESEREKVGGLALGIPPVPFPAFLLGVGVRVRTMAKKMVPNQALNGNTVGGSASFKARPWNIVPPDWWSRMEFAGGCQKVSSLCERSEPLFTALYRSRAAFVLLLPFPLKTTGFFLTPVLRICAPQFQRKWTGMKSAAPTIFPLQYREPWNSIHFQNYKPIFSPTFKS